MDKIAKSRSKNKIKGTIPQLYLKPGKKESLEIKPNKIPKKKLKFNESNRHFGNDITNSIKNNAQYVNNHHSFHQKSSSVSNKVNIVGAKQGQVYDNNSSLKKMSSNGRNNTNKNVEKTFSGDNLYHKKKITESMDNKHQNNCVPAGPKLKQSNTNIVSKSNIEKENEKEKEKIPSPKNKDKLIRISEYKIEPMLDNNKNENKNSLNNNKELINRLKNQSCSLKSSITNKNQSNNGKNKTINHIFDAKEFLAINKHLTKEQLIRRMNILSKHDTFELGQKKVLNGDKNKFNKNAHVHKEVHNNSNNLSKNKNIKPIDILFKIKNLKTFHPNKQNNKSVKKNKENKDNIVNNNKENDAISDDKTKIDEKNDKLIEEEKQIHNNENKALDKESNTHKDNDNNIHNKEDEIKEQDKENDDKEKDKDKDINSDNKENNDNLDKSKNEQKEEEKETKEEEIELIDEENNQDKEASIKNDTSDLDISRELVIYFDTVHITNVQIPKDYLNTIYYNLLAEEGQDIASKPVHTYMKKQKEINDQMRSILVDWIIDVHHKFGFTDETLFMTVSIIDRYCSSEQISRIKYQCLGITALMIACKHEEINVPKVEDFIYITDNAYTKEEVFKMENDVLSKLNFELLYPSPIKFYEYLSLHFNFSKKYHFLGKYLMETFLLDLKYVKYKPSVISCACTYIVMKFFKMINYRQSYEKKFFLLDENVNTIPSGCGVKDCAQDICIYVDNINNTNLLSCQKKYSKNEFENVSTLISNNKT